MFWLTAGVLASLPAAAVADSCKLVQAASINLTRADNDIAVFPVTIGGKELRFALNTGSVVSFITTRAAPTGYRSTSVAGIYVSGRESSMGAIIPTMSMGGLVGTDQLFVLVTKRETIGGTSGEIGLDKLEGYDVEIDLAHDKLNLFKPDHCKGQVVYWTDTAAAIPFQIQPDGQINIPMELDGKTVNVLLDTTKPTSEISFAAVHRLFGATRGDLRAAADEEYGDYRRSFHTLNVGGLAISNPDIAIYDYGDNEAICDGKFHVPPHSPHYPVPYRCYGGGDMRIGLKQLRALRLFVDFSEKMLYVTPADAH